MNLHFRLLLTILLSWLKPKLSTFEETSAKFTVLPTDAHIPFFKAMCGGRYVDFMDLARVDQVSRLGILGVMRRKKLDINLGGQFVRYHKPLKTFRRFEVRTNIVCWDEKFFYVDQKFMQDGVVKAHGLVQACFRGKGGICPPAELIAMAGMQDTKPAMPKEIADWRQLLQRKSV